MDSRMTFKPLVSAAIELQIAATPPSLTAIRAAAVVLGVPIRSEQTNDSILGPPIRFQPFKNGLPIMKAECCRVNRNRLVWNKTRLLPGALFPISPKQVVRKNVAEFDLRKIKFGQSAFSNFVNSNIHALRPMM
jgi:hypothetical protein